MKKILTLIMGCMLAASLVACGNKESSEPKGVQEEVGKVMDDSLKNLDKNTDDLQNQNNESGEVEEANVDEEIKNGAVYINDDGNACTTINLDNNEAVFIWYGADADGNEAFLIMTGSIDGDTITLTDTTEATDASGDAKTYTAKLNGKIDTEDSYVEFDFEGADSELSWVMNNISDKQKAQQSVNYIQDGIYGILNTANTKQ